MGETVRGSGCLRMYEEVAESLIYYKIEYAHGLGHLEA